MSNIRQLRYFAKVIETGSFTRAASELHVSQPALSLQIRRLEESLGTCLFVRGARGTVPTPGGLFLYKRTVELLNSFDEIGREMRQFKASSSKKQLTLGFPPSIGRQLGAQLLLDASACIPNVFLRLIESYSALLWETASRGEIDVGLMYDVEKSATLEMKALLLEHFGLFERNDGRQSSERLTPLRDVLGRKLVVHSHHKSVLQALMDAAERHSMPLEVALDTESVEAITDIVEQGFAAAVLPYGIMADAVRSGRVTAKRIIEPNLSRKLYFVRPKRRGGAKLKIDIAKLVDVIRTRLIRSLGEFCQPL